MLVLVIELFELFELFKTKKQNFNSIMNQSLLAFQFDLYDSNSLMNVTIITILSSENSSSNMLKLHP